MRFTFPDFKLIPYTRMTQGSKWTERSQKYISNQQALGYGYKQVMNEKGWSMFPPAAPLQVVRAIIQRPDFFVFDLDNALKACLDAANGVVFPDDRYIVSIHNVAKRRGRDFLEIEFDIAKK